MASPFQPPSEIGSMGVIPARSRDANLWGEPEPGTQPWTAYFVASDGEPTIDPSTVRGYRGHPSSVASRVAIGERAPPERLRLVRPICAHLARGPTDRPPEGGRAGLVTCGFAGGRGRFRTSDLLRVKQALSR
jgi:hypothetical protein